ncbi:MAG: discoidin domain-containing protein, partial [Thermoanaerobaculia bacterium]
MLTTMTPTRRRAFAAAVLSAVVFAAFFEALEAQENVALRKPARQSSGYNGPGQDQFPAGQAVDGNLGNFQHTWAGQVGPAWWEVDLEAFYEISFIVLHNRGGGCCQSRHRDLTVQVLDFSGEGETALYTSPLLNPENVLGGGGTAGPSFITLNLLKLTGGPVTGTVVRVTRTPDPDLSGTGGQGNADEPYVLQLGEVEVFQGDCPEAVGVCTDLTISGPANGGPGIYTASATGAGDPLYFTFTADNGTDPPMVFGPQAESLAPFPLTPGTWTISVAAGDSRLCPSESPEAICTREVTVKDCSADPLDTRCDSLTVQPPHGGNYPGFYRLEAAATDASQDVVVYTFSAENGVDPPLVVGPTESNTASFLLGPGAWTVSVKVRDNRLCPPDDSPLAACSQAVEVKSLSALANAALQGTARQSSDYATPPFPAGLAIDDNLNNFTHTASADDAAAWEVDLGDSFSIEAIILHNRRSCCASRLRDITVSILDFDGATAWSSQLLNEENALGGGMANAGPPTLTLPLLDLEGKAIVGRTVRVARAPDPDNSGAGFVAGLDESN